MNIDICCRAIDRERGILADSVGIGGQQGRLRIIAAIYSIEVG